MPEEKVLERVRKLLELSKNNENVHEAANAAAQAQALMSRFAIDEMMLAPEADTVEEQIEADLLFASGGSRYSTWRGQLAVPMCEINQCQCYAQGGELRIIGRPADASKVRYLFSYVAREIERLCRIEASERGTPGKTWCNNFKLGAASEIGKRLRAADRETRAAMRREADAKDTLGSGAAIVLINSALARLDAQRSAVEEYGKRKLHLVSRKSVSTRLDGDGREAGRRAASQIDLSGASKGALGSGARRALSS